MEKRLAPSVISGIENSRLNEYILYVEKGLGERIKMIRVLAISAMLMIKRQYIASFVYEDGIFGTFIEVLFLS